MNSQYTSRPKGRLTAYCATCGMMLTKKDRACPKCDSKKTTQTAPPEKTQILAVGFTRFTQYTNGNQII